MKNLKILITLIAIMSLCWSCGKDETLPTFYPSPPSPPSEAPAISGVDCNVDYECTFVQNADDQDGRVDDEERAVMEYCSSYGFTTKEEIEENLIGEWELVGYGHGWTADVTMPCSFIEINDDELILDYENSNLDTTLISSWEVVEEMTSNGGKRFSFAIGDFFGSFDINQFCNEYMYGDYTSGDGNMYMYKKRE